MTGPGVSARQQQLLTLALFGVAFGTQSPSPILLFYTRDLGLSATELTVFFTVYAFGLVPALLLGGPLSDRRGRKPVIVPVVGLCVLAQLALLAAALVGEPALYVGRVLQGLTAGAVFTVGTVWMREMAGPAGGAAAAMRASAAMAVGFALGPLLSGTLVQWAPLPKVLGFVVPTLLLVAAFVIVRGLPETMTEGHPGRLQIGVPQGAGAGFAWYLLPAGLLVYTYAILSLTLFPLAIARAGFGAAIFLTGVCALIVQGSAALATAPARRLGPATSGWVAAVLAAGGSGFGYLAVQPGGWPWVLPASLLIGIGEGLALTSGVTVADLLAPVTRRGGLISVFYLVVYFGFTVPTIVSVTAGQAALDSGAPILVLGACALLLAVVLAGPGRTIVARHAVIHHVDSTPSRVAQPPPG
ncbi:MAG: MFS transporter [Lapillicoccus sp.]